MKSNSTLNRIADSFDSIRKKEREDRIRKFHRTSMNFNEREHFNKKVEELLQIQQLQQGQDSLIEFIETQMEKQKQFYEQLEEFSTQEYQRDTEQVKELIKLAQQMGHNKENIVNITPTKYKMEAQK